MSVNLFIVLWELQWMSMMKVCFECNWIWIGLCLWGIVSVIVFKSCKCYLCELQVWFTWVSHIIIIYIVNSKFWLRLLIDENIELAGWRKLYNLCRFLFYCLCEYTFAQSKFQQQVTSNKRRIVEVYHLVFSLLFNIWINLFPFSHSHVRCMQHTFSCAFLLI